MERKLAILLLKMISLMFVVETLLMIGISHFTGDRIDYQIILLDSVLLALLCTPVVYRFILLPHEKQRDEALQRIKDYQRILDQHAIISTTDLNGTIDSVNSKFCEVSGYSESELLGRNHRMVNSGSQEKSYWKEMYTTISKGKVWHDTIKNRRKDGSNYWVTSTIAPLTDLKGNPYAYISVRTDITHQIHIEQKLAEANAELSVQSQTDSLTGIFNRRAFDDYLDQQVKHSKRTGDHLSLILIDIDYFKTLNDSEGHLIGDETLSRVAKTIRSSVVRDTDRVCRYGGDEFAVVLPHTARDGALAIAQKIQQSVATLNLENKHSPITDRVTLSIGVGTHHGESPYLSNTGLIATADSALYRAKTNGRNQIC